MKQLEVQIMGQSYLLGCPPGGESKLLEAVERVDTAMCKIRDSGKVKARDRIAVLASLNLAFDLAQRDENDTKSSDKTVENNFTQSQPRTKQDSDVLLNSLLERLDAALGEDGRLI